MSRKIMKIFYLELVYDEIVKTDKLEEKNNVTNITYKSSSLIQV